MVLIKVCSSCHLLVPQWNVTCLFQTILSVWFDSNLTFFFKLLQEMQAEALETVPAVKTVNLLRALLSNSYLDNN